MSHVTIYLLFSLSPIIDMITQKKTLTQNKSNEYVSFSSNIRLEENIILIFFDILLLSIPFIYKMLLLPTQ